MKRITIAPRPDWTSRVESQGLTYHTTDGAAYWDESVYYELTAAEVDALEEATFALNDMCLEAVGHVIEQRMLGTFEIPRPFWEWIEQSWDEDAPTIYGRFDLAYDGQSPPRLLEYNADTPTALVEAAVIQWFWYQDQIRPGGPFQGGGFDQFNSIHERLIEAWADVAARVLGKTDTVYFSTMRDTPEDEMTIAYLRDTAIQAKLPTEWIAVEQLGWNARQRAFLDLQDRPIATVFKLYPWEWMLREAFGLNLPAGRTRWIEPPWKMILSNKAILTVLWDLFPHSEYLLPASFQPLGGSESFVAKPIFGREGANVSIVHQGRVVARSGGLYDGMTFIHQRYHPTATFDGKTAIFGSWMVNGHACGVGIREDDGPITRNTSRFVPHVFRK